MGQDGDVCQGTLYSTRSCCEDVGVMLRQARMHGSVALLKSICKIIYAALPALSHIGCRSHYITLIFVPRVFGHLLLRHAFVPHVLNVVRIFIGMHGTPLATSHSCLLVTSNVAPVTVP